jgi:alkanesulfonate monooxygenase SsuD/methylene tetrahydromethanopterin reductase-like flavin-dependent oxidoreductase (luciferase family)
MRPVSRSFRVGVQLPEVEREVSWREIMAIAQCAEACGFDSVWTGDHLLYRDDGREERGPLDAWSVLAGLAAVTERVEIGPLVACAGFRAAGLLARAAATVDNMSGGRLVLGLGCGWNRVEFDAFGIPFDNRVARFETSFGAIRRLLAGEHVTGEGPFGVLDNAVVLPRPASARPIPLMVGSNAPRMLGITLPHVNRWNTWWDSYGNTASGFEELNARISEACTACGRPPTELERSACMLVVLDPNSGERSVPVGVEPVGGSNEEIAEKMQALADAGADEIILVVDPITEASVDRLGEVLGLFR